MMTTARRHFSPLHRALHWLMALCIIAMLFIGVGMVSTVRPDYLTLIDIHKPLGLAILILAIVRLVVRFTAGTPRLPADLPEPMKLAAHLSHYLLYAMMIAMPLIGWAMVSAGGYPVTILGGLRLPALVGQSDSLFMTLRTLHVDGAFVFFALILMHLAAALFHALVRRDGVFEAMSGGRVPSETAPAE